MQKRYCQPLSGREVQITDPLFGHYADMVSDKVIPHQWNILNDQVRVETPSHCLQNFRIAAGETSGEFYGEVFQDTDVYKWLEAVSYCIENGKGERLSSIADEVIDLITRAQQPDGYLNTYYTLVKPKERWSNLVEGHELYNAGYLIEAAIAYYKATGKRTLLNTAIRFADLITKTFGAGADQILGYPGHQEIELALVKLYRVTGEKKYLDTAYFFIRQRGTEPNYFQKEINGRGGCGIFPEFMDYDLKYSQAHMPPVMQRSIEGHAVRAMYMCAAMADLALEYNDKALLDACTALWESATERRMFITGGVGSSGYLERFTSDFDLPNDTTYCETCASVGLMMFGQRMTELTGKASYYDVVERALHNTVLAGISANGLKYFYVNPLEVVPGFCLPSTAMKHVKPERQDWFSVACCPTNVARTLASLGQYIYAKDESSLYINQFISSVVSTEIQGREVSLSMDSKVTRGGNIQIRTEGAVSLRVRIPYYAEHPVFKVNGLTLKPRIERGYACFNADKAVDIILDFHIVPRWVSANDRVRSDLGKTALMNGPLVYCLEERDNQENLASISVLPDTTVNIKRGLTELPGNMPILEYEGYRIGSQIERLYGAPVYTALPIHISAVPYCLWGNRGPGEMLVWQRVRL